CAPPSSSTYSRSLHSALPISSRGLWLGGIRRFSNWTEDLRRKASVLGDGRGQQDSGGRRSFRRPRVFASDFALTLPSGPTIFRRSEEHTSELQSRQNLVCRLL